ncbi:hypothetical protein [Pseudoduganella sp. GCM10020061]|uniref:hypothetical protein n=1 Tax=Pseudoduganella sp. GCM10020061 TaxID=3317345 RepID=UPI003634506C
MKELFFSELRRFRTIGLIAALVHLMAIVFLNQLLDLPQQGRNVHVVVAVFYMLSALGFSMYQFGSYRTPGRWTWLMHRPLAPRRIFAAIVGASFALVLLIVAVPLLLVLGATDLMGERVVDVRHYLAVAHIALLCLASGLAGGYVILNHRRSAAVILVLPILAFFRLGSAVDMLAPALLCVALLAYILSGVFKPNHHAPPESAPHIAAAALPLLAGFYIVALWGGSTVYQWGQMLAGVHPLGANSAPAGGYAEASRMTAPERLRAGLAAANTAESRALSAQVGMATAYAPDVDQYPVRHQASNAGPMLWPDASSRIIWSFSHDDMRYSGRDMLTRRPAGHFGAGGRNSAERFTEVPADAHGYLLTPHTLYRVTGGANPLERTFGTRGAEQIVMAPDDVQNARAAVPPRYRYVLTNARLVALDKQTNAEQFSIILPDAYSNLGAVDVAELADGSLVSILFGRKMNKGSGEANQHVMFVPMAGAVREVARRPLQHDFGVLFEHKDFWLSPVLGAVIDAPDALIADGTIPDVVASPPERSATVWTAALAAALLSALASAAWLARTDAPPRRKLGWIAAALLLGLPALLTLMALQPRTRRVAPAAWPAPAPAT